jgi:hypothetical protein
MARIVLRDVKTESSRSSFLWNRIWWPQDKATNEIVALKRINTEQAYHGFRIIAIRDVMILEASTL